MKHTKKTEENTNPSVSTGLLENPVMKQREILLYILSYASWIHQSCLLQVYFHFVLKLPFFDMSLINIKRQQFTRHHIEFCSAITHEKYEFASDGEAEVYFLACGRRPSNSSFCFIQLEIAKRGAAWPHPARIERQSQVKERQMVLQRLKQAITWAIRRSSLQF